MLFGLVCGRSHSEDLNLFSRLHSHFFSVFCIHFLSLYISVILYTPPLYYIDYIHMYICICMVNAIAPFVLNNPSRTKPAHRVYITLLTPSYYSADIDKPSKSFSSSLVLSRSITISLSLCVINVCMYMVLLFNALRLLSCWTQ